MADPVTGLADAIDALRVELSKTIKQGAGADIRFRVRPVELTVQAVVTKGGDGKIGWGVLSIGGKLEAATTQSLKLQLEPLLKTADGSYTTDFSVADQARPEEHFGRREYSDDKPST